MPGADSDNPLERLLASPHRPLNHSYLASPLRSLPPSRAGSRSAARTAT